MLEFVRSFFPMSSTPRLAAAALIRQRASSILPRVVTEATTGDQRTDLADLQRNLTAYLERRIPLWVQALEADDTERTSAIRRLLRADSEAGEVIPPVVLLGTVAIGYRLIESEIRNHAAKFGFPPDALWAETDLLRRTVGEMRRQALDHDEGAA